MTSSAELFELIIHLVNFSKSVFKLKIGKMSSCLQSLYYLRYEIISLNCKQEASTGIYFLISLISIK